MSDCRVGPIDDYEQRVAEVRRRISELQRFWFGPLSEDRPHRPQEDVSSRHRRGPRSPQVMGAEVDRENPRVEIEVED